MRISSSTIFNSAVYGMEQQQSAISQTQQEISSGVKTPTQDPVAAAQALMVNQASSINTQYVANQNAANSRLSLNETTLQGVTTLIQNIQSQVISAGNASLTNSDRSSIATQLNSEYQQLINLANSTDGTGVYLFSGGMGSTQPFQSTSSGVQYSGDQGKQYVQIGPSQQVQVSLSGADLFQNIPTGNGSFVTQAASGNGGNATIDAGLVTNPSSWNASGKNFTIQFSVSGGNTTYNVIDNSTGTTVASAQPYTSGNAITLGTSGASVSISGTPLNGDSFTVKPSTDQSVFTTISNMITALQAPVNDAAGNASITNSLDAANQNLSNALNSILTARSANGARINQATAAQSTSNNLNVQYQTNITQLQGVDLTQAISQLSQETLALQAAQKTFVQVSNLSLFSYLP